MIYLSSTCSQFQKLSDILNEFNEFGFKNIELSGNVQYDEDLFEKLKSYRRSGFDFLIHNYFPPPKEDFVVNLASFDQDIQQQTFSLIQRAGIFMEEFDIDVYGIHGGHDIDMQPQMKNFHFIVNQQSRADRDDAMAMLYRNLEKVMQKDYLKGRRLAVENLTPKNATENYALMSTREEIENFLDFSQKYDQLGFLLDLGHLHVAGHYLNFDSYKFAKYLLKNYREKIFMLHLSDNEGTFDNHHVHAKDSWQLRILDKFYNDIKNIPVVFEWNSRSNKPQSIKQGIEHINSRYSGLIHI